MLLYALATAAIAAPEIQGVTVEEVKHALAGLKANGDISSAIRDQTRDIYQQALSALDVAEDRHKKAAALQKQGGSAPGELIRLQRQLNGVAEALTPEAVADLDTEDLLARQKKLASRVTELQAKLQNLHTELTRLAQRPSAARKELADTREALRQLDTVPDTSSQGSQVMAQAKAVLAMAQQQAKQANVDLLKQELATLDVREQVQEARQALVQKQLERASTSLSLVRVALASQQRNQAGAVREQAEARAKALAGAADIVISAAQHNVELATRLAHVSGQNETATATRTRLRDRLENLQNRFNLLQRQLQIGGASVALANVLRKQKRLLVDKRLAARQLLDKLPDLAAMELQAFQLQQTHRQLEDTKQAAQAMIDASTNPVSAETRQTLNELLQQRQDIVGQLASAKSHYVDVGYDLQAMARQYRKTASAFSSLVDERLFWLPSFTAIDWHWLVQLAVAVPVFFDSTHFAVVTAALAEGARLHPWVAALGVLLFIVLIGMRGWLREVMRRAAQPVGNVTHDTFWLTLRTAAASALLCLPWALLLALAGWLLGHASETPVFVLAVSVALMRLGQLKLIITTFREVCRPFGLAQSHFQWPDSGRRRLRRSLRHLLVALLIPTFFVSITDMLNNDALRETIGRITFIFGSLALAWFAWHVLHPARGILRDVFGPGHRGRWLLGYVWMPLVAGVPVLLAGLTAWGYYYTALQLEQRYFVSAGLLGGSIIVYSLIVRWVTVTERRMALARALRKREEAREARATREAAAVAGEGTPDSLDTVEIDLVQISEQARTLIRMAVMLLAAVGLWFVWADLLPALNQLNSISLWQHVVTAGGESHVNKVTLGALLLALLVGVITALAGRNLPGFLEIVVLRQFALEAGSRYAIAKLFQYAIVTIGLLVAVSMIGVSWSSIQWLVAALGVGLGFGLQEIFANFVSGLVILFERPVRVGDTVSVGQLTGTVSRVRIRATTVTDWDNKEVIIPNKTFITETVINWTLTDAVTRLIVRVSIARDADTDLAERLITEAIENEPSALGEPAPSVFIVAIEEGQIVFEARVFFYDLYYLLPLQHALYRRIKDAFAEHDIEISFPQQDLHIRSLDESIRSALLSRSGQPGSAD